LKSVKSRMIKRTHKFEFRIPRNVKEVLQIDQEDGTHLWHAAILNEMTAIRIALDVKEKGSKAPIGCQYIDCHMIFDVKMDFTQRFVSLPVDI
jgi:hypothetical protein